MQPDELRQLQQRVAQLERENAAFRAEIAALRESESCFRNAFEQATIGMAITNLQGRWLHINQYSCDLLGYTDAEMLALTCADLNDPDTLAANRASVQRLIAGEIAAYQTEMQYLRKDGSSIWASLTTSLVRDAAGNPAALISVVQDISQRKEAESIAQGPQRALQQTLALLATEPELDKFLGQVLATIIEQLDAAAADIWFHDAEQTTATLHMSYWNVRLAPEPIVLYNPPPFPLAAIESTGVLAAMKNHQPFLYSDLPNHPDAELYRNLSNVRDGVQTMLLIPLVFDRDFLGALAIGHMQHHAYSPEALRLVTALAQPVVLAMQVTRLAEAAKQVAIFEEQNRLAREIHDTLAQTFTGISLQLNNAQYYATQDAAIAWEIVDRVKTLARAGLIESRRLVWSLHPDAQEYRDLVGSLQQSSIELTLHTSLQTDLKIVGTPKPVPPDIGMNLLRICQEAITNTLRHALAQTLQIEITFKADAIALCIRDDGKGFALQSARDLGGFGLLGMQQRCDRLGGQFTLYSQPGRGTCILVEIPFTFS